MHIFVIKGHPVVPVENFWNIRWKFCSGRTQRFHSWHSWLAKQPILASITFPLPPPLSPSLPPSFLPSSLPPSLSPYSLPPFLSLPSLPSSLPPSLDIHVLCMEWLDSTANTFTLYYTSVYQPFLCNVSYVHSIGKKILILCW